MAGIDEEEELNIVKQKSDELVNSRYILILLGKNI